MEHELVPGSVQYYLIVRFESYRNLKNAVFWYITPCGSFKDQSFEEHITSVIRVTRIGELERTLAITNSRCKCLYSACFGC
jgi:hypothetical protein